MYGYDASTSKKQKKEAELENESARKKSKIAMEALTSMTDSIIESEGYKDWLASVFRKYAFYERIGGVRIAHCECGASFILERGRGAEYTFCPGCHDSVVLRNARYPEVEDLRVVSVLSNAESDRGISQRLFVARKEIKYASGEIVSKIFVDEEQRDFIFFNDDSIFSIHPVTRWVYDESNKIWEQGVTSFKKGRGKIHGQCWSGWRAEDRKMSLYPGNLPSVLHGSKYQYSSLDLANCFSKVNPIYYLREYSIHPMLELLYKAQLIKLAEQLLQINDGWYYHGIGDKIARAKSLKDLFINSKSELDEAVQHNYGYDDLQALSFVRKWKLEGRDRAEAVKFMKAVIDHSGDDFEYDFISNESLFRYAGKQKLADLNEKYSHFFSDYTDYIGECITLGYDVKNTAVSKPHNFKKMHDYVMAIKEFNRSHVYDVGVAAAWKNLHDFVDWTDGNLSVIMAKSTDEIVKEGADQNHCVGRYCERVAKSESVICFVRRNEEIDKAFYTLELKPDMHTCDIVQCRGKSNEDDENRPIVDKFLEKYRAWFNKRKADFDENNLKAVYYKAVRKNKKGEYVSIYDNKVKYQIGVETVVDADKNPDSVAVKGMHIASLDFAKDFGRGYDDAVILEVEVNIHDVIIPDAKDQVRCSRYKILREVPYEELGEWGAQRLKKEAA